jgi:hypothetical protein
VATYPLLKQRLNAYGEIEFYNPEEEPDLTPDQVEEKIRTMISKPKSSVRERTLSFSQLMNLPPGQINSRDSLPSIKNSGPQPSKFATTAV